jgi:hypothetical protein
MGIHILIQHHGLYFLDPRDAHSYALGKWIERAWEDHDIPERMYGGKTELPAPPKMGVSAKSVDGETFWQVECAEQLCSHVKEWDVYLDPQAFLSSLDHFDAQWIEE